MLKDTQLGRRGFLRLLGGSAAVGVSATSAACSAVFSDTEFIIIGSGAGGGPLAANLARNGHQVLLIEAGNDYGEGLNYQVPAFAGAAGEDPAMSWAYYIKHYSEPARQAEDPKAVMIGGQPRVYYPRAGTLGGCTSHNQLFASYPYDEDWDYIASVTGDSSWSADNMRRYFTLLENCAYLPAGTPGHGFDGWFTTSLVDPISLFGDLENNIGGVFKDGAKALKCVLSAAIALGEIGAGDPSLPAKLFSIGEEVGGPGLATFVDVSNELYTLLRRDVNSADPNRDKVEGIYNIPQSVRQGRRNGARDYLVATTIDFPNTLRILTDTLVTRILFDANKRAIGVEYINCPAVYGAAPNPVQSPESLPRQVLQAPGDLPKLREIILCGGAFNSPQILKLSGVGPTAELQEFGIPVVTDLPGVGENLQDRYEIGVVSTFKSDLATPIYNSPEGITCDEGAVNDPCLTLWQSGAGPYAVYHQVMATVHKKSTPDKPIRDMTVSGLSGNFHGWYPGFSRVRQSDQDHFSWYILKDRTLDRAGTVKRVTKNPWDPPDINLHYFDEGTTTDGADDDDLRSMVEGVKFARQANAVATQMIDGGVQEVIPGPLVQTDADIANFVKRWACGHHVTSSCKIGADSDPMAVLDSNFNVRGTQGLRVVDASVFPRIPGRYPMVAIYQVSEKAFDAILATLGETRNGNAFWSWTQANP
jgi:choline dehydrogenase